MDGMITKFIDNRKITPTLDWADFRGFSLLFDNPGNGFEPIGKTLERIHCDVEHTPELAFYRNIKQFFEQVYPIGMQKKWHFCQLPPTTYHVTAWDGLNDFNRYDLAPPFRTAVDLYFKQFEASFAKDHHIIEPVTQLLPSLQNVLPMTFKFSSLLQLNYQTLVVTLCPADDHTYASLVRVMAFRKQLNEHYQKMGATMHDVFVPHISLGYFANSALAQRFAATELSQLNKLLKQHLEDATITFNSISLYGFTNMINFFRKTGA
jgi:hypothetical protein